MGLTDFFANLPEDWLSHDAKVELIYSTLPGFIEEGLSANKSLEIFKNSGLGIGRSEFLGIYRDVLGLEEKQNRVRYVSRNNIPSEGVLDSSRSDLKRDYLFVYKYEYVARDTGYLSKGYLSIDTDYLDTISSMEAEAADYINENYGGKIDYLIDVRVWKGFKAN